MIPSDIRLYTWVDVEEVLFRIQEQDSFPEWLVWVRAYWDSLTIGICPGTQAQATGWLQEVYDPRFKLDAEQLLYSTGSIILESTLTEQRTLPVILEETEEEAPYIRLVPSLARPGVIVPHRRDEFPQSFSEDFPPVVAFHSFKGGVGRTTHALAFAQALVNRDYRVLLIDGDMEAPGISWLFEKRLPFPPVSFADLLALAHGDASSEASDTVKLVAERLQNAFIDNIYVLPSLRSTHKLSSLEIKPEHLIQGAENPFVLTQLLAALGKSLSVDVVLIDLRAGLSELSTGLLLDPRVYRIFVTTLSGQSIAGTTKLLELLGERAPSIRNTDPLPAIIISQVPDEFQNTDLLLNQEEKLLEAAKPFLGEDLQLLRVITRFANSLQVLPSVWEEAITRLNRSGIVDAILPLMDLLPTHYNYQIEENLPTIQSQRETLKGITKKLVFAETAEAEDFLATIPLRNLASDHRHQVPITVVVGAKGSGKTYTFLQIIRRENWQTFAEDACATKVQINAFICPILASKNLVPSAVQLVRDIQKKTAQALGFDIFQDTQKIRDYIGDFCQLRLHEGQWRERWLDIIAWGIGFQSEKEGAGRALTEHLSQTQQRLLVVIDGLEDLFQNFAADENQQTALRALIQEVPEWFGQQPGRPLDILIFIRRDMVLSAIRQNAAQIIARYEPYALKWNREEALRLVAWVAMQSQIYLNVNIEKLQDMREDDLTEVLVPLWGKKLGSDSSKEAASARFVIAALSDFRGQIQSRDLVRLLNLAARESVNDIRWQDRILVPAAIKGALPECSTEKIAEIELENTALKEVFTKLRGLGEEERKIPFTREQLQLSIEEMKILEDNGIVIREKDDYYMPEIYRLGLGFSLTAVGRPAVMSLARRAAKQGA